MLNAKIESEMEREKKKFFDFDWLFRLTRLTS